MRWEVSCSISSCSEDKKKLPGRATGISPIRQLCMVQQYERVTLKKVKTLVGWCMTLKLIANRVQRNWKELLNNSRKWCGHFSAVSCGAAVLSPFFYSFVPRSLLTVALKNGLWILLLCSRCWNGPLEELHCHCQRVQYQGTSRFSNATIC